MLNLSNNPTIKLIQVTDCHLLAEPKSLLKHVSPKQSLKQVCDGIRRLHGDADALLYTGDISQDGSSASYFNFLDAISELQQPAYALPGNHDDFDAMHAILADKLSMEKVFTMGEWRILMLNSQHPDSVAGHLSASELAWLAQQLADVSATYFLIAIHHQPTPTGSDWMDQIGLHNWQALQALLTNDQRVRLLIHGHTHQADFYQWQQLPCFGTPSSWRQFAANTQTQQMAFLPPAYRVIELFSDGGHRSWVEFVQINR